MIAQLGPLPDKMPFNDWEVDKLQLCLLDRYAASAFNVSQDVRTQVEANSGLQNTSSG